MYAAGARRRNALYVDDDGEDCYSIGSSLLDKIISAGPIVADVADFPQLQYVQNSLELKVGLREALRRKPQSLFRHGSLVAGKALKLLMLEESIPSGVISQLARYEYEPLPTGNYIRLLELRPGKANSRLLCQLRSVPISEAPSYSAISYAWGHTKEREDILCEGRRLSITPNLGDALRRFRSTERSRFLWADNICIDQNNVLERGHQVKLMASIFESAAEVLIWLGADEEDAAIAFKFLNELSFDGFSMASYQEQTEPLTDDDDEEEEDRTMELEAYDPTKWKALARLYNREWFQRTWTIQEVALASRATAFCGNAEIDWFMVLHTSMALAQQGGLLLAKYKLKVNTMFLRLQDYRPRQSTNTFLDLLEEARVHKASDPRDKVFGLLSHPRIRNISHKEWLVEPDYSKSTFEIYREVASRVVNHQDLPELKDQHSLSLLSYVSHSMFTGSIPEGFPSWIPRWDHYNRGVALNRINDYAAAGKTEPVIVPSDDANVLLAYGTVIDTVYGSTNIMKRDHFIVPSWNVTDRGSRNAINDIWAKIETYGSSKYPNGNGILRAISATLAADISDRRVPGPENYEAPHQLVADFSAYLSELVDQDYAVDMIQGNNSDRLAGIQSLGERGRWQNFLLAAMDACNHRKFFCSEKGYFGIGPPVLQDGDKICVLFGANTPFILRPDVDGTHKLVGECYVNGLMNGEAIQMLQKGKLDSELFEIR
ncbi:HET-domain-containing protein [Patellaria atrata CBS 101060]|uniref:HET-domain-containing protein n=1 Tax=Patellaria atrata CBS 101060 TaxID=1346257 RepID=A0A9P4VPC4_9PEZI|nr:HET-domain-containing protein [Patellaria atrata CBS 101060]